MEKTKLVKIKFEYISSESTEWTDRQFKANIRDKIGKCIIRITNKDTGSGYIKLHTDRSKKDLIDDLNSPDFGYDESNLSEWEFS